MALDLSTDPDKGKEHQSLLWATDGIRRALHRLNSTDASYYDAIEAAFWIGAAADAADEKSDPFLSAFYYIANNGRHAAMVAFQGVHHDSGPMLWDSVDQWVGTQALKPPASGEVKRVHDYKQHLSGKEVVRTVTKAHQQLLGIQRAATMTFPADAGYRLDPVTGKLTIFDVSKSQQLP